jgi:hypothetical protein
VIAKLKELKNVEMDQQPLQLLAETTKLQLAKKDVHLQNLHLNLLQIHVIAKLLQLQNVEVPQPTDQLLAETTKLLHVH